MKSLIITLVTVAFGIVSDASADNPKKLAEEFLTVIDTRNVLDQMIMQIKHVQQQQFSQMGLTESQQKEADKIIEKSIDFMQTEMSWDKMKDDFIAIYTSVFTEEELKALLEFYKSPIGKKFIERQPALIQKSMEIGQKKMLKIIPKIQEMTEGFTGKQKK